MGEIIRVLGHIKIRETQFDVELNNSVAESDLLHEIHVQNEHFRLALPEVEFLQLSAAIMLAKRQLEILKENNLD